MLNSEDKKEPKDRKGGVFYILLCFWLAPLLSLINIKHGFFFSFPLLTPLLSPQILTKIRSMPSTSQRVNRGWQSNAPKSTCHTFQGQEGVARLRPVAIPLNDLEAQESDQATLQGPPSTNGPSVSVPTAKNENKRSEMPAALGLLTRFDDLFVFTSPVLFWELLTQR